MQDAQRIIAQLGLRPHPEGGHFVETWRDAGSAGGRGHATAIYYLLQAGERSHWHRVDATEIWHFHAGQPLLLETWDGHGEVLSQYLGGDVLGGERPQMRIPPGCWQAAAPLGDWTLVSCTVAPAFDFAGFDLAPDGWAPPQARHPQATGGVGAVAADTDLPALPSRHLQGADVAIQWRWLAAAGEVHGSVHFGPASEGLPSYVHGGLLAAICDEAMGWVCWMAGHVAPGARINAEYLTAVRSGQRAHLRARLVRQAGRQLALSADLRIEERLAVRVSGRYVSIQPPDLQVFAGWPGVERFGQR